MLTFEECCHQCLADLKFVKEFDRLTGCSLAELKSPINAMVDEATGKTKWDMRKFVAFVYETVWLRLPPTMLKEKIEPPEGQSFRELMHADEPI